MRTWFASAVIVAVIVVLTSSRSYGQEQSLSVGSVETVMSAAQRLHVGLTTWPDSTLGAVLINGTNYVFAANSSPNGTLGFMSSDLNGPGMGLRRSASSKKFGSRHQITQGKGRAFDHDYAGGSAVYYDAGSGILIHLYHGEYWYHAGTYIPFYAGLGLVFSTDMGATWHKLGEVISPQAARAGNCNPDVGAGTLVPVGGYLYAYYTDIATGCTGKDESAVARASISSVIAAAKAGKPFTSGVGNLFQKYYKGDFNEPGVTDLANPQKGGGAFTTLWTTGSDGWPSVMTVSYNSYLQQYVAAYVGGWRSGSSGLYLRFSTDGIVWGAPTEVVKDNAAFYPTLFNTSGGDPNVLGSRFYLYYVSPFPNFSSNLALDRIQINVGGGNAAPPPPTPSPAPAPNSTSATGPGLEH
jgi:hypothetical protein